MKTENLMNALNAKELNDVNGGVNAVSLTVFVDHIHCIQPEPGTCSCSPGNSFAKH